MSHVPCSFSYIVVKFDGSANKPVLYRTSDPTENVSETFLKRIMSEYFLCMKERKDLFELYKTRMIISDSEKEQFKQATVFASSHFQKKDIRVADHCHLTGTYLGPAH